MRTILTRCLLGSNGQLRSFRFLNSYLVPLANILSNLELPKILAMDVTTSALVQLLSDSVNTFIQNFRVSGPDLCNYSRNHFLSRYSNFDFKLSHSYMNSSLKILKYHCQFENFVDRAPVFVGDVLWEHLQLLKQEAPYYLPPRVSNRKHVPILILSKNGS